MADSTAIFQFIRFGIVGFSGVFVDFGLTWIFREKLKFNQYLANSIGFCAAVCWNFWLNRIWTFESRDPNLAGQFGKFFLVSLIGLGLNNGLIYLFSEKLKFKFYPSKLVATGLILIWNFFANRTFTFR
jgi:putative flippase GtrA